MKVKTLLFLSLVGSCFGELDIPRSVFSVENLEEAKAAAVEENEPLIFVYTDPGTT